MELSIARDTETSSRGSYLGTLVSLENEILGTAYYWPKWGMEFCFEVWPYPGEDVRLGVSPVFDIGRDGKVFARNQELSGKRNVEIGTYRRVNDECLIKLRRLPINPSFRIVAPLS